MNTNKKTLGTFLKAHRLGEDMTQVEFAKFLGISKQRLNDIEHDRFNTSLDLCIKISKKLKLPAEWLAKLALQQQINEQGLRLEVGYTDDSEFSA